MSEVDSINIRITATDEASANIQRVSNSLNSLNSGGRNAQNVAAGVESRWTRTGKSMKDVGGAIDDITKPLQFATAGTLALGVASGKAAMDYETAFTGVRKTVDGTEEQLAAVDKGLKEMSKTTPVSAAELANLAAVGGQLGIETGETGETILKFTKTMADMGAATNLTGEQGAAAMARFLNVMGESKDNVDRVGSSIVDLGNHTATSEAEIAEMALRMGKFGNTVGMNSAQVLGYSAALSSLGIEAQMGGSAIGRTWLSIQEAVSGGGESLEAFAKYAGVSAADFKKQWSTDPSGAFNSLIKGLSATKDLTKALGDLGIDNIQDKQAVMALANGYDLMTDCLNRSSKAYEENTALTNEANAAYNTVANKLKMAMNAVTNAGIEWGNVLLPEVQKGAEWIGKAGEALGNMSEGQKQVYLGIGKTVLVTGALSKAVAVGTKTIGGIVEGIGTLRGLFAGGVLTGDAATAAVSIGKVSGAVGGLILACVGAKKASEYVYDLNYNWSKGLEKGDKSIDSSLEKYQKINAAQKEISQLKLTIESPESSQEQVETAKQRLEEIKQMLSEEYNLVIKADNSDLDDVVKSAQKISKNELQQSINEQSAELWERRGKFESYVSDYEAEKGRYNNALAKQTKFSDLKRQVSELDSEYRAGNISLAQYNNSIKDLAKNAGLSENAQRNAKAAVNEINTAYDNATYNAEQYSKNMENLTKAYTEVQDKAKNVAKADAEMLNNAAVEGDTAQMEKTLSHMADIVKTYKLNAGEFAQTAALAMNGLDSLNTAWEKGGDTLNGVVSDYIRAMNEFGASAQDTTVGAALIQNGFADIGQAAAKGDEAVKGVLDSIKAIGQQQGLFDGLNTEQITAKINDIAHAIGLLPKNKELTIDGKVVWKSDTSEPDSYEPEDKNPTVVYGKDSTEPDGYQPTDKNATAIFGKNSTEPDGYQPENKYATVYYKVETIGGGILNNRVQGKTWNGKVKENAKGTQNFSGGLAMVNDEEGVSDNRELIIDGGRAFIPHGRNVILPLSRGAKVYTARQTKRIMTAMGIPHYAQGKDNSEAFTTAKDDWTHYTKTHAVTITQELEKWVELSEKFKDNQKDIEDIEEEIYLLTVKENDEKNKASEKWADKRIFNNDWEEYGDDIYSAYDRIKVRNMEMVSEP